MSDQQQDLSQSLDFGDLNLTEMPREETVEGNIRLDLQAEPESSSAIDDLRKMALFSRIPVTLTLEVASVEVSLAICSTWDMTR